MSRLTKARLARHENRSKKQGYANGMRRLFFRLIGDDILNANSIFDNEE